MNKKPAKPAIKAPQTITISLDDARAFAQIATEADEKGDLTKKEQRSLVRLKKLIASFGPVPIDPG